LKKFSAYAIILSESYFYIKRKKKEKCQGILDRLRRLMNSDGAMKKKDPRESKIFPVIFGSR